MSSVACIIPLSNSAMRGLNSVEKLIYQALLAKEASMGNDIENYYSLSSSAEIREAFRKLSKSVKIRPYNSIVKSLSLTGVNKVNDICIGQLFEYNNVLFVKTDDDCSFLENGKNTKVTPLPIMINPDKKNSEKLKKLEDYLNNLKGENTAIDTKSISEKDLTNITNIIKGLDLLALNNTEEYRERDINGINYTDSNPMLMELNHSILKDANIISNNRIDLSALDNTLNSYKSFLFVTNAFKEAMKNSDLDCDIDSTSNNNFNKKFFDAETSKDAEGNDTTTYKLKDSYNNYKLTGYSDNSGNYYAVSYTEVDENGKETTKYIFNNTITNPYAPMSVYTDLWCDAVMKANPTLWNKGLQLISNNGYNKDVLLNKYTSKYESVFNSLKTSGFDEVSARNTALKEIIKEYSNERIKNKFEEYNKENESYFKKNVKERLGDNGKSDFISKIKEWLDDIFSFIKESCVNLFKSEYWNEETLNKVNIEEFMNMPIISMIETKINPELAGNEQAYLDFKEKFDKAQEAQQKEFIKKNEEDDRITYSTIGSAHIQEAIDAMEFLFDITTKLVWEETKNSVKIASEGKGIIYKQRADKLQQLDTSYAFQVITIDKVLDRLKQIIKLDSKKDSLWLRNEFLNINSNYDINNVRKIAEMFSSNNYGIFNTVIKLAYSRLNEKYTALDFKDFNDYINTGATFRASYESLAKMNSAGVLEDADGDSDTLLNNDDNISTTDEQDEQMSIAEDGERILENWQINDKETSSYSTISKVIKRELSNIRIVKGRSNRQVINEEYTKVFNKYYKQRYKEYIESGISEQEAKAKAKKEAIELTEKDGVRKTKDYTDLNGNTVKQDDYELNYYGIPKKINTSTTYNTIQSELLRMESPKEMMKILGNLAKNKSEYRNIYEKALNDKNFQALMYNNFYKNQEGYRIMTFNSYYATQKQRNFLKKSNVSTYNNNTEFDLTVNNKITSLISQWNENYTTGNFSGKSDVKSLLDYDDSITELKRDYIDFIFKGNIILTKLSGKEFEDFASILENKYMNLYNSNFNRYGDIENELWNEIQSFNDEINIISEILHKVGIDINDSAINNLYANNKTLLKNILDECIDLGTAFVREYASVDIEKDDNIDDTMPTYNSSQELRNPFSKIKSKYEKIAEKLNEAGSVVYEPIVGVLDKKMNQNRNSTWLGNFMKHLQNISTDVEQLQSFGCTEKTRTVIAEVLKEFDDEIYHDEHGNYYNLYLRTLDALSKVKFNGNEEQYINDLNSYNINIPSKLTGKTILECLFNNFKYYDCSIIQKSKTELLEYKDWSDIDNIKVLMFNHFKNNEQGGSHFGVTTTAEVEQQLFIKQQRIFNINETQAIQKQLEAVINEYKNLIIQDTKSGIAFNKGKFLNFKTLNDITIGDLLKFTGNDSKAIFNNSAEYISKSLSIDIDKCKKLLNKIGLTEDNASNILGITNKSTLVSLNSKSSEKYKDVISNGNDSLKQTLLSQNFVAFYSMLEDIISNYNYMKNGGVFDKKVKQKDDDYGIESSTLVYADFAIPTGYSTSSDDTSFSSFGKKINHYKNITYGDYASVLGYIADFVWNTKINVTGFTELSSGHLGYYGSLTNLQKRNKQIWAAGNPFNTDILGEGNDIYRMITLDDDVIDSNTIWSIRKQLEHNTQLTQKEKQDIINQYLNITATDGQTYRTFDSYCKHLKMSGKWSYFTDINKNKTDNYENDGSHDYYYWAIKNGKASIEDFPENLDSIKPYLYGKLKVNNYVRSFQKKDSESPLTAEFKESPQYGNIRLRTLAEFLSKNNIDAASCISSNKVASMPTVNITTRSVIDILNSKKITNDYSNIIQEKSTKDIKTVLVDGYVVPYITVKIKVFENGKLVDKEFKVNSYDKIAMTDKNSGQEYFDTKYRNVTKIETKTSGSTIYTVKGLIEDFIADLNSDIVIPDESINQIAEIFRPTKEEIEARLKEHISKNNGENILQMPYKNWTKQSEVKEHFLDKKRNPGTQLRVMILGNLPNDVRFNINGKEMNGKELKQKYIRNEVSIVLSQFIKLCKQLNTRDKASKMLMETAASNIDRYGINLMESLQVVQNENGELDFRVDPSSPFAQSNLGALMCSMISKRIQRFEFAGGTMVQASNIGGSNQFKIRYKSDIKIKTTEKVTDEEGNKTNVTKEKTIEALVYNKNEWDNPNNCNTEKEKSILEDIKKTYKDYWEYLEEVNKHEQSLAYSEVAAMLPTSNTYERCRYKDENGNYKYNLKNLSDEERMLIGYRVPTEGKMSMMPIMIKKALPQKASSTIILPNDWVTISGSDFDIDKLYIDRFETYSKLNEKPYINVKTDKGMFKKDLIKNAIKERSEYKKETDEELKGYYNELKTRTNEEDINKINGWIKELKDKRSELLISKKHLLSIPKYKSISSELDKVATSLRDTESYDWNKVIQYMKEFHIDMLEYNTKILKTSNSNTLDEGVKSKIAHNDNFKYSWEILTNKDLSWQTFKPQGFDTVKDINFKMQLIKNKSLYQQKNISKLILEELNKNKKINENEYNRLNSLIESDTNKAYKELCEYLYDDSLSNKFIKNLAETYGNDLTLGGCFNAYYRIQNSAGFDMVGATANQATSLLQFQELALLPNISALDSEITCRIKDGNEYNKFLKHRKDKNGKEIDREFKLGEIKNALNKYISFNFSELQGASVDNVKTAVLANILLTGFTSHYWFHMLRAGMDLNTTSLLVNQPIIVNLDSKLKNLNAYNDSNIQDKEIKKYIIGLHRALNKNKTKTKEVEEFFKAVNSSKSSGSIYDTEDIDPFDDNESYDFYKKVNKERGIGDLLEFTSNDLIHGLAEDASKIKELFDYSYNLKEEGGYFDDINFDPFSDDNDDSSSKPRELTEEEQNILLQQLKVLISFVKDRGHGLKEAGIISSIQERTQKKAPSKSFSSIMDKITTFRDKNNIEKIITTSKGENSEMYGKSINDLANLTNSEFDKILDSYCEKGLPRESIYHDMLSWQAAKLCKELGLTSIFSDDYIAVYNGIKQFDNEANLDDVLNKYTLYKLSGTKLFDNIPYKEPEFINGKISGGKSLFGKLSKAYEYYSTNVNTLKASGKYDENSKDIKEEYLPYFLPQFKRRLNNIINTLSRENDISSLFFLNHVKMDYKGDVKFDLGYKCTEMDRKFAADSWANLLTYNNPNLSQSTINEIRSFAKELFFYSFFKYGLKQNPNSFMYLINPNVIDGVFRKNINNSLELEPIGEGLRLYNNSLKAIRKETTNDENSAKVNNFILKYILNNGLYDKVSYPLSYLLQDNSKYAQNTNYWQDEKGDNLYFEDKIHRNEPHFFSNWDISINNPNVIPLTIKKSFDPTKGNYPEFIRIELPNKKEQKEYDSIDDTQKGNFVYYKLKRDYNTGSPASFAEKTKINLRDLCGSKKEFSETNKFNENDIYTLTYELVNIIPNELITSDSSLVFDNKDNKNNTFNGFDVKGTVIIDSDKVKSAKWNPFKYSESESKGGAIKGKNGKMSYTEIKYKNDMPFQIIEQYTYDKKDTTILDNNGNIYGYINISDNDQSIYNLKTKLNEEYIEEIKQKFNLC